MKMFLLILFMFVGYINSFRMISSSISSSSTSFLKMMEFDNNEGVQRGQWSSIGIPGQGRIKKVPENNRVDPSIRVEGPFNSIDFYCCQRATQTLVSSHIANWAEIAECYTLRDKGNDLLKY